MTVTQHILVYTGPGTKSTNILLESIKRILANSKSSSLFEIYQTSWKDLKDPRIFEKARLLIIPGGRDLPYVEHIKAGAINNIRAFIHGGGSYLGICAGAYFACTHVLFDQGGPLEVTGPRQLSLLNGKGVGPVYPGFIYNSTKGSRMAPLIFEGQNACLNPNGFSYFNGGGEFVENENFHDFHTIAYYRDFTNKKAIVTGNHGAGKVTLSFVHPEMSHKFLQCTDYNDEQWSDLVKHEDVQYNLFENILNELLFY